MIEEGVPPGDAALEGEVTEEEEAAESGEGEVSQARAQRINYYDGDIDDYCGHCHGIKTITSQGGGVSYHRRFLTHYNSGGRHIHVYHRYSCVISGCSDGNYIEKRCG